MICEEFPCVELIAEMVRHGIWSVELLEYKINQLHNSDWNPMEVILFNFIIVIATGKNEINKIKKMKQDPNSICKGLWVIYMCIHAAK